MSDPAPPRDVVRLEQASVHRRGPNGERRFLVRDATWSVREGEHWAVLGPNGAGKTTLLRIASAQMHPSTGAAALLGGTLGRIRIPQLRHRIGVVDLQVSARFFPGLSAVDVVLTGVTGTSALLEEHVTDGRVAAARELLRLVAVEPHADRPFAGLSQGERARVMLARALITDAALLVLDEAGAGLDLPGRELLIASLARIAGERPQLASIVATHHVEELPSVTTHALLLRDGVVVAAGPIDETLTGELMSECFGLPLTIERREGRFFARASAGTA
ncbi:MAG TPA: ATP-binding cassette domain-containing protein [Gaiellaceae bacterium]|nr:ATP-binding cassette domain-containing protein [Gaiellaceae bacterium]